MNWFKRLCLFVFGLSGLLALAALSLVWIGPWQERARTLILEYQWYRYILAILVCVAGLGLLVIVLRALFTPRNPRETIVAETEAGNITVTRVAIVSQAKAIIEADGTCLANSVRVKARKRGHVRVNVRVTPRRPVNVVACGEELYNRLGEGLAQVCGDTVQSIGIVFTDPELPSDLQGTAPSAPRPSKASVNEGSISVNLPANRPTEATVVPDEIQLELPEPQAAEVEELPTGLEAQEERVEAQPMGVEPRPVEGDLLPEEGEAQPSQGSADNMGEA